MSIMKAFRREAPVNMSEPIVSAPVHATIRLKLRIEAYCVCIVRVPIRLTVKEFVYLGDQSGRHTHGQGATRGRGLRTRHHPGQDFLPVRPSHPSHTLNLL